MIIIIREGLRGVGFDVVASYEDRELGMKAVEIVKDYDGYDWHDTDETKTEELPREVMKWTRYRYQSKATGYPIILVPGESEPPLEVFYDGGRVSGVHGPTAEAVDNEWSRQEELIEKNRKKNERKRLMAERASIDRKIKRLGLNR